MATFLPNLTDQIPDLPLYQPNIGFFQQQMQRKSNTYEQGFGQVKGAYDSILNAPLTNNENIQARDSYLKQAQDQLKNLSSVDLSLQQNVDAANNVFAPFWQDDKMLKDASLTKYAQSEMQKGFQLRDSKDKADRDQYSGVAMQYISNGLDKMKSLSRDDISGWNNLEKRRFTPFVDEASYWNDQLKKQDFKVEWDEMSGQMVVKHTNGQKAIMAFQTFAQANMSPQMRDMHNVIGTVEKESRIKQVKEVNPNLNLTDQQALELVSDGILNDIRSNYTKNIDGLTDELTSTKNKITEFTKAGPIPAADTTKINRLNELLDYQDQLTGQLSRVNKEYEGVKTNEGADAKKAHDNLIASPDYYFANLSQTRSVNNWASAAALNEKRTTTLNPIWKEQVDIAAKNADFHLQEMAQNLKEREFEWKKQFMPKSSVRLDENGNPVYDPGGSGGNLSPDLEKAKLLGTDNTDITKTGNAYELFQQRQKDKLNLSNASIFSMEGLGRTLVNLPAGNRGTVSQEDIVTAFSAINRFNQEGADPSKTSLLKNTQEQQAYYKIADALKAKTGVDTIGKGPETMRNALISYAKQYFSDKSSDGGLHMDAGDFQSFVNYNTAVKARDTYLSLENKKQALLKSEIIHNPEYKDITRNGDIMTKDEYMKSKFGFADKSKYLNEQEKHYNFGDPYNPVPYYLRDWNDAEEKYNTAVSSANQKIVPNLPEYNNQTGKMGNIFEYKTSEKGGRGNRLIQEAALPGNHENIYIDGQISTDTKMNNAIQILGSLGDKELSKYFSNVQQHTNGVNGQQSLEFIMNPIKDNDRIKIGDLDLNDLVGKKIEIPLSKNAKGPTINALPANSGNYIYQSLLQGTSMSSDPLLGAANFSYKIVPDHTESPQGAYITINRKVYNKNTGKYEDTPEISDKIDFYGANAKTPDELVGKLNEMFMKHLLENQTNQKLYTTSNSNSTVSVADLINNHNQNKNLR